MALRFFLMAAALCLPSLAPAAPEVVILVRHAEKQASTMSDDVSLTAAGRRRAEELARDVAAWSAAGAKVTALFASEMKRTQETLAPLAAATHLAVTKVNATDPDALVRQILAVPGGIAVVAGHSNRLPAIIKALGGPAGIAIADSQFDRFFVLTAPGSPQAKLVVFRYGE